MKKTERGIYLNLNDTEYFYKYKGLVFYFSSLFYKKKFIENVTKYLENESLKLQIRYNLNINFDIVFLISFYKKIEKRGFRIYDEIKQKEITTNCGMVATILMY